MITPNDFRLASIGIDMAAHNALAFEQTMRSLATEQITDDYTAYDRGDLCSELDRVLGDLIERTMHRYMPRKIAQSIRRNKISELADSIIGYDQTHGESNSNPT